MTVARGPTGNGGDRPVETTSIHVRRAVAGDQVSVGWLIDRFSPLLRAQADHRLRGRLRTLFEPDDLVADVWAIVLPKLPTLPVPDRRFTPVLVRFLSTTLLNRFGTLLQKHIRGKPSQQSSGGEGDEDLLAELSAQESGHITRACRSEVQRIILDAIRTLDDQEREIVVFRGIEQIPNQEVAGRLGLKPNTVAQRYSRALTRLRELVPASVFDDLPDE